MPRLICLVDPDNEASLRVAANVGFVADGEVEIGDELLPLLAIGTGAWSPDEPAYGRSAG